LAFAGGPPRQASQYDHEQPQAGHIYVVPESPPLYLPDDWESRLREAGACAFEATADRTATLTTMQKACVEFDPSAECAARFQASDACVRTFQAIGFGYLIVEHLFDAMQHEHMLSQDDFWQDMQNAVGALTDPDPEAYRTHLQAAADKLLAAREILYPTSMHLLDIFVPDAFKLQETMPAVWRGGATRNLVASSSMLQRMMEECPDRFNELRECVQETSGQPSVEICCGAVVERADALLPVESQLWNLRQAIVRTKELVGAEVRVFARRRSAFHTHLPQFLMACGYEKALLLTFDGAVAPTHRSTVVSWSAPDGKQLDAFCRTPKAAHESGTFFNLVHSLHESITQDSAATFALIHTIAAASPGYAEWQELSRFGPVLGQWTSFSRFFADAMAGEYAPASTVDDFFSDDLEERTNAKLTDAVSGHSNHLRKRRRLDAAWSFLAIHRALGAGPAPTQSSSIEQRLRVIEAQLEQGEAKTEELAAAEMDTARLLADRLQSKSADGPPGYVLLNPCSFVRRLSLELNENHGPIAVDGPVKACQILGDKTLVVVDVPSFGFAWMQQGKQGTPLTPARVRMADSNVVRNEFLEAEIDMATGGLRAIRDLRTRINRLGQQIVFNPGSSMKVKNVRVTSNGPALGEIVTEGGIHDEQGIVLATFRQRFRAWMGRPLLDLRIEIYPEKQPEGYPWHSYFGARFAWRDDRATLFRGQNCTSFVTNHTRPVTPDFLELRFGQERTTIFPCGLPFHQRHGSRMVDVIMVPEAEQGRVFDLAIGLDREYPAQTALGLATPATVLPTEKGPPKVGPSGWLFHLDAHNIVVSSLRPAEPGADAAAAIVATMIESTSYGTGAELRCARNPVRAVTLDCNGQSVQELPVTADAVSLEFASNDLQRVRVDFP
jgi:hypothetical protein